MQGKIAELLENAYRDYHSLYYRPRDPVHWVHHYSNPRDQEVVALFSAVLAYGNVTSILSSVGKALAALGPEPHLSLREGAQSKTLEDFTHRFTRGVDLQILCHWLAHILETDGSVENHFLKSGETTLERQLSSFVRRLFEIPLPSRLERALQKRKRNLFYLLPDPARGSACKRLNLFLRWMVRPRDGIDLGLWKRMEAKDLILPVDTHLLKALQRLKWTKSKTATWRVAEAATAELRKYAPHDPVRYDFALCHLSMEGGELATLE